MSAKKLKTQTIVEKFDELKRHTSDVHSFDLKLCENITDLDSLDEKHLSMLELNLDEYLSDARNDEDAFKMSMFSLKRYLSRNNYSVKDDVWGLLFKDEVIEVYDTKMIQQWKSLNFFKYISYSMAELVSTPFPKLFSRPISVTANLVYRAKLAMWMDTTIMFNADDHIVTEKKTGNRFKVSMGIISPIKNEQGKNIAVLVSLVPSPADLYAA